VSSKLRIFLAAVFVAAFLGGCAVMKEQFPKRDTSSKPSATAVPRSVVGAMKVYRNALKLIDELEYAAAEIKLQTVSIQFDRAGDIDHTAESTFWLGFCREKLQHDDLARQAYVSVIQRFPNSKPAKQAQQRLDTMNQT
jgi:TolA-binding protein